MALLNTGRAEALAGSMNYVSQAREQLTDSLVSSAMRGSYSPQRSHHHMGFAQGISASSSDVTVLSEGEQPVHSSTESDIGGDYTIQHGDLSAVPHLIHGKGSFGDVLGVCVSDSFYTGLNSIGDVSHNPEDLRFQYPVATTHTHSTKKKVVYREQVCMCVASVVWVCVWTSLCVMWCVQCVEDIESILYFFCRIVSFQSPT